MGKEKDWDHLRLCLDTYNPLKIYIRDCGGYESDGGFRIQGKRKVCELLEDRTLDFLVAQKKLHMLVDQEEIFCFPLQQRYQRGFTVAYERFLQDEEGLERMVHLSHGENPYDPRFPEPKRTILRIDIDNHLMEITFDGRIHLAFDSWMKKPHFAYWKVITPQERIHSI